MTNFTGLSSDSGLTEVLKLFPRHSETLLRLLNDIMCDDGTLSRSEREAIAALRSQKNSTPYCVLYHTMFSEVLSAPVADTSRSIEPLLAYADALHTRNSIEITKAHKAALKAGWSEAAVYEVVEVCGIFDFINAIVLASGITTPDAPMHPRPRPEDLDRSYAAMADAIRTSRLR